jgi:uncharacterized protein (DUF1810 family)
LPDPFKLQRFLDAQEGAYLRALEELKAGCKSSHWMWYIFPQIAGLGRSTTAVQYSISGLAEARAYVAHPILGARLIACCEVLSGLEGNSPEAVFRSIDAMKLRSSLTLFDQVSDSCIFKDLLRKYYAGHADQTTLELIEQLKS